MNIAVYLLLTMTSLCHAFQEDILGLLNGDAVILDLDLSTFTHMDEPIDSVDQAYSSATHATSFLNLVNNELRQWRHTLALAEWDLKTNMSEPHRQQFTEVSTRLQEWRLGRRDEANRFHRDRLPEHLSRQLELFTLSAVSRNSQVNRETADLQTLMETIYNAGRVCLTNGSCLALEPEVTSLMSESRNADQLQEVWTKWRASVGPAIKQYYVQFIQLLNQGAQENRFSDYSQFWSQSLFFQTPDLDQMVDRLWSNLRPFYQQLHAYVRRKLTQFYGAETVGSDGTIPAHLLGDLWAQHWTNIWDIVVPYPEEHLESEAESRLQEKINVRGMFELAERFYRSVGMFRMTSTFWSKSIFRKQNRNNLSCQAEAFDMFYPGDFRIKMCTRVSLSTLRTVYHEMGHVQYAMAYADQPTIFRDGANAAFQEAVGDAMGLSVMSTTHLRALGLLTNDSYQSTDRSAGQLAQERQYRAAINNLLHTALDKLTLLPFALLVDSWRWKVMQGEIIPESYNRRWWDLRLQIQGIRSPVPRLEEDFDPGCKYQIPANSPYISYFISYIQQFQMFKSLCQLTPFRGDLHQCDLFGYREVGRKLRNVLSEGSSVPWQTQLDDLTGSAQVTTDAFLEYFQPLYDWLVLDNFQHGETIGWSGAEVNWVK